MNSSRFLLLKWKWGNKLLESETTVLFVLPSPILASLYSCSTLYVGYVKALLVKNSAAFWNLIQNSCGCGICSPRVKLSINKKGGGSILLLSQSILKKDTETRVWVFEW